MSGKSQAKKKITPADDSESGDVEEATERSSKQDPSNADEDAPEIADSDPAGAPDEGGESAAEADAVSPDSDVGSESGAEDDKADADESKRIRESDEDDALSAESESEDSSEDEDEAERDAAEHDDAEHDDAAKSELEELAARVKEAEEQAQQHRDRLLRTAADFENFRKRSRRDLKDSVQRAEDKIVIEFLPIVDNLERAIAHGGQGAAADEEETFLNGVRMVHKQFLMTLAKYQIEPFESVGHIFDPELHEAIQQMPSDKPRHTVVEEMQKGYRRGEDRLVRPALVVVSEGPSQTPEDVDESSDSDVGEDSNESGPGGLAEGELEKDGESSDTGSETAGSDGSESDAEDASEGNESGEGQSS